MNTNNEYKNDKFENIDRDSDSFLSEDSNSSDLFEHLFVEDQKYSAEGIMPLDSDNFVFSVNYDDMDDLNVGIIIVNAEGKIKYFNNEIRRLGEITDENIIGQDLLSVYSLFDIRDYYSNQPPVYDMEKVLTTGTNRYARVKALNKITSKSGAVRIVQSSMIPMKEGNKYAFAMLINDTSARYESDNKIPEQEKFFSIFATSPIAIAIINLNTFALYEYNQAFSKLTNYDSQELLNKRLDDVNLWLYEHDKNLFYEYLSSGKNIENLKTKIKTKNNTEIICELSSSYINFDNNRYVIIYLVDITNKVSEELRRLNLVSELEDKIQLRNIELENINKDLQEQILTRQRSEKNLSLSKERYTSLVKQLPVGIYRMDTKGTYIECNPSFLEILGYYSLEDLCNDSKPNFLFESFKNKYVQPDISKSITFQPEELQLQRKNGENIWINNFSRISIDENNEKVIDGVIINITTEKKANDVIHQSELKYRKLFENLNDIYVSFNINGYITNISPSYEKVSGISSEEVLYKHFSVILNDDMINSVFLTNYSLVTTNKTFTASLKNSINSSLYYSFNLQAIYDKSGDITGYEGIARNITNDLEHSKVLSSLYDISAAINETESLDELYRNIHQTIGKVIYAKNFFIALVNNENNSLYFPYFIDETDNFLPYNISLDNDYSYTVKVIKSKEPLLFKYTDQDEENRKNIIGSMSLSWLGVPLKLHNEVIGAIAVQSYSNFDQFDESDIKFLKSVSNQIAIAIDRKNQQIHLDNQLKFISNLIDTIPNPIYFKNAKTLTFELINDAFAKLLNKPKHNILNKNFADFFSKDRIKLYNGYDEKMLSDRQPQSLEETIVINNEEKQILTLRNCYYNSNNELEGILAVILDITNQKRATDAIRDSLKKEKELNELKTKFISMVSHEFRTPLQSILLSTDLLGNYSDKMGAEDKEKQYDRIKNSVKTLNLLIDDVLLINKSERGQTNFAPNYTDIPTFLQELIANMEFVSNNNVSVNLEMFCEQQNGNIDEKILSLALTNLISNAVKYSKPNGNVTVKADIGSTSLDIQIIDEGIGIPEKDQEHLFTPFYRSSNVGAISGTGLGLSIVKDAIVRHRGIITYKSKENIGTTFSLHIPYA